LSPFISASNFDSSYIPLDDIIPAFKWIAALLSIPYLVQVFKLIDLKFLQRLKIAWIAGVLVNIVIQLFQTFSVMNIAISTLQINDLTRFRFSGLATHPNALAISVCLSLPIIYEELRKVNFTLFLATNLLFFTSVFLTQSRAGLIVYAFGFLMCFLRNENSGGFRISRLLLIIIILSTLVLSGFFFYLLNNSRFQTGDTSALISNQARWGLMKFGYEAFRISPMLGLGPTLFKVSHNIYLQVLSSLGFIGFVFFIVLCFRMIQRNWKSNYFTSVTILIFLLFGFFNNSLTDFYLYFPLGFGFLISSHNLDY
jgi:O-antigen ligase